MLNKKRNLRRIVSVATTILIMAGTMGVSALASTYEYGKIKDSKTSGSSYIERTTAYASTMFGTNGSVTVSSKYSYINTTTLKVTTISKNGGHNSNVTVSFTAPQGCRSVRIDSNHTVSGYNQKWTATTSAIY